MCKVQIHYIKETADTVFSKGLIFFFFLQCTSSSGPNQ